MANLNPVSSENLNRAEIILNSVSGKKQAPRVDYPPYIEEAVAGAALALEKGHPNALRLSRDSTAEDWLNPKSFEGQHFHRAVARVLGGYDPGVIVDMSPKGIMEHIVTDTVTTTLANKMKFAVSDHNPIMVEGMNDSQIERVKSIRKYEELEPDLIHESRGEYDEVSHSQKLNIINDFYAMTNVSDIAKNAISQAAKDIDLMKSEAVQRNSEMNSRIADFKEEGVPLFAPVNKDYDFLDSIHNRVDDLFEKKGAGPMNEVEAGVVVQISSMRLEGDAKDEVMAHEARVAVLTQVVSMDPDLRPREEIVTSPHATAMRIEGLIPLMKEASGIAFQSIPLEGLSPSRQAEREDARKLADGEFADMSKDAQIKLYQDMVKGEHVPALKTMTFHNTLREMSSIDQSARQDMAEAIEPISFRTEVMRMSDGGIER